MVIFGGCTRGKVIIPSWTGIDRSISRWAILTSFSEQLGELADMPPHLGAGSFRIARAQGLDDGSDASATTELSPRSDSMSFTVVTKVRLSMRREFPSIGKNGDCRRLDDHLVETGHRSWSVR
jgi:hypothetical protein